MWRGEEKGSPGGFVQDGTLELTQAERSQRPMVARLAARGREPTHVRAVSLGLTRARTRRPQAHQDWSVGPCNPCLHVWGKVERQHQMGGCLGGEGAAIKRNF